ncbi:MAG: alpha/beta hydrolase [bacterium]|nr:alpha/beta hydrolase [bacterium]
MQEKLFIQNRKGQKIAVLVERPENPKGLAFVMHGLGGFKEQPHIKTFAEAFLENNYTVVRFDTTNTFGESEGNYEDATTTNYYEDLEGLIEWAKSQNWYREPFCLAGHSLGGICTALYAEKYSEKVKGVAPISTVVSGQLTTETPKHHRVAEEWERTGWREEISESIPGLVKRLKWSHMEDRLKYDLLPEVRKLTMPILLIVGEKDDGTPPEHQQILYEKLPGRKEIHIIKNADHNFRNNGELNESALKEVKDIFDKWIKSL